MSSRSSPHKSSFKNTFENCGKRVVFLSRDLYSIQKMTVVTLMNHLAGNGYHVTVITNAKNHFTDYRYDYRIKRLALNALVKGCYTRKEVFSKYVSESESSVFIFTDCLAPGLAGDLLTVKKSRTLDGKGHKAVLFATESLLHLLSKSNTKPYSEITALWDEFDAVVSNYPSDCLYHNKNQAKNLFFIPYLYPFKEGEYARAGLNGSRILLLDSYNKPFAGEQIIKAFSKAIQTDPDLRMTIVSGYDHAQREASLRQSYEKIISDRSLEDRIDFAENGTKLSALFSESMFALHPSLLGSHTALSIRAAAYLLPTIMLLPYRMNDTSNGLLYEDVSNENALAEKISALLSFEHRKDLSDKFAAHLNDSPGAVLDQWECLLTKVALEETIEESFNFLETEIVDVFSMLNTAIRPILSVCQKPDAGGAVKVPRFKAFKKRIQTSKSLWAKLARAPRSSVNLLRYYFLRHEYMRTEKYTYTQISPEKLRKSQLLALKMLREFERICKKHSFRYYIAAGSLLGAIRHKGQIPWDDDVDVTMPRADYDKFLKIAQKELGEEYILPKFNYPYGFHRMQIRGTNIERTIRQKRPHGVFLDILPLDGAAPSDEEKRKHKKTNERLIYLMYESARPLPVLNTNKDNYRAWLRRLILKTFMPKKLMYWLWYKNATKYDTGNAGEWVCLPGIYGYEKECFPKEYWGEPCMVDYAGRPVPVMREWEKYLTLHYGNYMQPPADLEKRTHLLFEIDLGKYESMSVKALEEMIAAEFHMDTNESRSGAMPQLRVQLK